MSGTNPHFCGAGSGRRVPSRETPEAHTSIVSPEYFRVLEIPLQRGRTFTTEDRRSVRQVVIVNESVARHLFGGSDPIGQKLTIQTFDPNASSLGKSIPREIVGVVGDVKESNWKERPPWQIYLPLAQNPLFFVSVVMRTARDPAALALTAQREIAREDRDLPASAVGPMEAKIDTLLGAPRRATTSFAGFALLAVLLAAMGIYGVLSYTVAMRTREVGIRMALGATPAGILKRVLQQALRQAAWGAGPGCVVLLVAERWLGSQLFGIRATDPLTPAAVTLCIFLVALAAALAPARSAARVDPIAAAREL